jgi:hypothetical protein
MRVVSVGLTMLILFNKLIKLVESSVEVEDGSNTNGAKEARE